MLTVRWIILPLALAIGIANSQEEPPRKPNAQKVKQQRDTDNRGTEKSPLVVKTLNPDKSPERIQEERAQEHEKADREERLVFWTLALAILTGVLAAVAGAQLWMFLRQLRLMKDGADDAKILAKAANASANAVMLAERAYVKMSHRPPGVQIREHDFWIAITIKNFGRTPARVIDVVAQSLCLLPGEAVPDAPKYNRPKDLIASNSFLVADEELSFAYVPDESIDVGMLKNGTQTLYVFGYVDYIDAFKVQHRAGYGRRYGREWDDPSRYGNDLEYAKRSNLLYMHEPQYNYDRQRKKGEGNDWDEQSQS